MASHGVSVVGVYIDHKVVVLEDTENLKLEMYVFAL